MQPDVLLFTSPMSVVFQYFPQLLEGLVITLQVSLGAFALGLLVGIVCVFVMRFLPAPFGWLVSLYVLLIRGLPELLVIFVAFYGGTVLLSMAFNDYVEVNALAAGIFALSIVAGAYFAEILRAALQTIPNGQSEAATTLGLNSYQTFFHVIMPQMFSYALPGIGNQWLVLLKDSALVSFISLNELTFKGINAANSTRQSLVFYLTIAALYILVTAVSMGFLSFINKRFKYERH